MNIDGVGATNATQQSIYSVSKTMGKAVDDTLAQARKMLAVGAGQEAAAAANESAANAAENMINLTA
jgi:hypothetical protein